MTHEKRASRAMRHEQHAANHPRRGRHPGKKKGGILRGLFWDIVFCAVIAACVGMPVWLFADRLIARLGMAQGFTVFLGAFLAVQCLVLLAYIPTKLVQWHVHRHPPKQPERVPVYQDILDGLERLANGDFSVVLKVDEQYNRWMMAEIAEKLNNLARQLSSMETMREDFVANVSHEIQSPLTSIRGYAVLLQKPDLDEDTRRHYLGIIEAECARLSKLSDNLLRLSVLQNSPEGFNPQPYQLDRQLADTLLVLEPQWRAKNQELTLEAEKCEVSGDAALLEQVWLNLVQNAVKFTPEGGHITVRLGAEPGFVCVTVADSGPGVAEADRPHIFERFYKGDKSRGSGGSGLGLSLVKRIVELHGGTVRLRANDGPGAVFVVEIPTG